MGKSGRQRLLLPLLIALFALAAMLGGHTLASHGQFDEPTNLLFEADCSRVIENSTDVKGEQGRSRLHPLHVVTVAPVGTLLGRMVGPELATVLITALVGAGLLYNVQRILAQQLALPVLDRALIVTLLGASASQVTFAMVPDTHLLSAFALSGMASSLTPERVERLRQPNQSQWAWFKAGGAVPVAWGMLAVGMLATNLAALVVLLYLLNPGTAWHRVWRSALWSAATLAVVLSLHVAQRKVWPPGPYKEHVLVHHKRATANPPEVEVARVAGPRVNAFSPPPPSDVQPADFSIENIGAYGRWVWATNARFTTPVEDLPQRLMELLPQFFWTAFFAPHFGLTPKPLSDIPGATFEPADFDYRWPGLLGIPLGMLILARLLIATRGRPQPTARPLSLFCLALVSGYLVIVAWYGDEAFLFSPNWVFATVLTVTSLYATTLRQQPQLQVPLRAGLACLAGLLLINSAMHVRDLFTYLL